MSPKAFFSVTISAVPLIYWRSTCSTWTISLRTNASYCSEIVRLVIVEGCILVIKSACYL